MAQTSSGLAEWLQKTCRRESLSLRGAAAKTGLSHVTIAEIMKGGSASATTIKKLAHAFSGNHRERLALEDSLLVLAGHRTERAEEHLSEPLARLLDKLSGFSQPQLQVMEQFADFILRTEK